jgi:hypothetical protein
MPGDDDGEVVESIGTYSSAAPLSVLASRPCGLSCAFFLLTILWYGFAFAIRAHKPT